MNTDTEQKCFNCNEIITKSNRKNHYPINATMFCKDDNFNNIKNEMLNSNYKRYLKEFGEMTQKELRDIQEQTTLKIIALAKKSTKIERRVK